MRVCVYTAIHGGYDTLLPQAAQGVPTDFVCYTESRALRRVPPWRLVRDARLPELSPRLRAKWFKTHPDALFPGGRPAHGWLAARLRWPCYDATIWIDGNIRVTSRDFVRDMLAALDASGLALFAHPDRDCIFDEATESVRWEKYRGQPIREQVAHYRAEGFPEHDGLWAGGIVVRRAGAAGLAAADEAWWRENLRWTFQDQLSLPVVLWRHGIRPSTIDGHLWFNDWYVRPAHAREEGPAIP